MASSERCCKMTDSFRGFRCSRTGVVARSGDWYCKQHDPEAVAELVKQRDARWDAKWKAQEEAKARLAAIHAAERAVICAARAWVDFEGSSRDKSVELRAAVAELDRLEQL